MLRGIRDVATGLLSDIAGIAYYLYNEVILIPSKERRLRKKGEIIEYDVNDVREVRTRGNLRETRVQ